MSIFLLDSIVVMFFVETVLLLLMGTSMFAVAKILKYWNFDASTTLQYALEKKNYLVNTIILFTIGVKIILFVFFVKSLDDLAPLVPGAMCATGVIGANKFGNTLLIYKIFTLFLLGVWVVINRLDLKTKKFDYLRKKYYLFIVIFALLGIEFALELLYFTNIPLNTPVFCCSVVFVVENLPFGLETVDLVKIFYLLFVSILVVNYFNKASLSFVLNILFLLLAYYCVTYFFGTYVYEEPNHKCPFCMLQKEYHYIGYLIWSTLFLGTYFGISPHIIYSLIGKKYQRLLRYNALFLTLFVAICSYYVISFYLRNGVFL